MNLKNIDLGRLLIGIMIILFIVIPDLLMGTYNIDDLAWTILGGLVLAFVYSYKPFENIFQKK